MGGAGGEACLHVEVTHPVKVKYQFRSEVVILCNIFIEDGTVTRYPKIQSAMETRKGAAEPKQIWRPPSKFRR